METKLFEMTKEDLDTLLASMQPVPMIMLQLGRPQSTQERANAAWSALGKKMGFEYMTVRPDRRGDRFFTATPTGTVEGVAQGSGWCDMCGGEMTWCESCQVWSRKCCQDYGTCQCS